MSRKTSGVDAQNNTALLKFAHTSDSPMEAEELLNEIDNLAVLLHEVRKQTDRIEAAADAIGDAILTRMSFGRATATAPSHSTKRTVVPIRSRTSARLRTPPIRASQPGDIQP